MKTIVLASILLFLPSYLINAQEEKTTLNLAIAQLVDLYSEKQIVALGENHGRFKEAKFRSELIKNSDFAAIVDVIVVEFANPIYQKTIDDYTAGKEVSGTDLRKVWQNTTQVSGVWDSPVYQEFFKTVRDVNKSLDENSQIRVIAADPPIEWSKVNSFADFEPYSNRGRYPIAVIEREVYEKNLKALLVFGSTHTELWGIGFTAELEKTHPNTIAVVIPPARNEIGMNFIKKHLPIASKPMLVNLKESNLGAVVYKDFHPYARFRGMLKNAAHFMLFLGFEKDSVVHVPAEIAQDTIYQKERKRRLRVLSRG